jgi:hypothetical protein
VDGDVVSPLGELPGGFAAGEAAADDPDGCVGHEVNLAASTGRHVWGKRRKVPMLEE